MAPDEKQEFNARAFAFLADHPRGHPVELLVADARGPDLDRALFALGMLQEWLHDQRTVKVLEARIAGRSWGWIGSRLGISRQALWERHRDKDETTPDD